MQRFLLIGAIAAGLAVAAGAFGAHALAGRVPPARLQAFETAVRYQMYHALALLVVGWLGRTWSLWQLEGAGYLFTAGLLLFSGSLYLLVLTDTPWFGAVTPFGGVAFLGGWALLVWAVLAAGR
ncbi:MAG: hypothetical protein KatS3mg043_2093 [Rhodothermaceae bacterium]|nr:MAG: hypothetical protein KatS3mg043_2093 [Rhodothermaceae bacterium]